MSWKQYTMRPLGPGRIGRKVIPTKNHIYKLLHVRSSVTAKITLLLTLMFLALLVPVVAQTGLAFQQAQAYREIIDNITYAEQLNIDVSTDIEPLAWNIVAGKVGFDDSGILPLIADIHNRMAVIRDNTISIETRGVMEIALRALATLENYLERLKQQIDERYRVAENERLLEEIRVCVAGISDLLQEFSFRQVADVAVLNEAMHRNSRHGFVVNILLIGATVLSSAFAFRYIIRGSVEAEKQRRILEYRVLQEQITPHFLYNTLDAIIWAAEAEENQDVITLVTSLSSFFRTGLSQGVDFVPVSHELEHIKSYLAIQQIRYSDILSYEIDAAPGLPDPMIPKLLLQPLVENGIYHGIKNIRGRGRITVSVKQEDRRMRFTVADNGIGMDPDTLARVRQGLRQGPGEEKDQGGYGLFNVNQRLKLYYEMPQGIEIASEYGKGTQVSFGLDIL